MTATFQRESTLIGRVRVRAPVADPLTAQQRISRLLGAADIRQTRLPPSAILIVRKMRDPFAGTRWLDGSHAHLGPEWERAVTRELDRFASDAAYPARGPVPSSAWSVAFFDRAEMIACLTRDWLSGTLQQYWWWSFLLGRVSPEATVLREWESAPELIPPALELLQRTSHAVEFACGLPQSVAARLLTRMISVHGVASALLQPSLAFIEETSDGQPVPSPVASSPASQEQKTAINPPQPDPWLPWIPEASLPGLHSPARLLLAYALLLRRAPDVVRSPWFSSRIESWRPHASPRYQDREPIPTPKLARQPARHRTEKVTASPAEALSDISQPKDISTPHQAHKAPDILPLVTRELSSGPVSLEAPSTTAITSTTPDAGPTLAPALQNDVGANLTLEIQTDQFHAGSQPVEATSVLAASGAPLETAFGGIFFLLNVALYLELYGDFSNPLHPGLAINIWNFLAILGDEFVGEDLRSDPLWTLLASLAGRNPLQHPGAGFLAPDSWRIPPAWLEQFPEAGVIHPTLAHDRFILTHQAKFRIVDVPLSGRNPLQSLADEMRPYPLAAAPIEIDPAPPEQSRLSRWTGWMTGYLRARLARALGRDDAATLLCRIPALLRITPAHVHIYLRLEGYPVEIRLAGLDRDPGWIPAAARHISFHFD
ncbi:MAG TPA: hypothetical protein VGL72_07620 [Bryobacteraceae bacterium]|jgi:hypothetical protein